MTEKTPETPRWPENWEYWHKPSCPAWLSDTSFERGSCECGLTDKLVALADEYKAKITHLEAALRDAEKDRDSWKETAKHTVSASIAETIDDIVSDLQAKLRDAETKAVLADQLAEHFDGDMHGDPCDAVCEFLGTMGAL